ncbi:MAG TPA: exosortase/archaeosortase family protein [Opitutaceae bacterium]|nr:exosortase/archaeosortase family protein [Opitutaceae bacterium]
MSDPRPAARRPLPRSVLAVAAALALGMAAYCAVLWPEWRRNPDLSHGFFAPVVFALLVMESVRAGPARWLPATGLRTALVGACLGASVALLIVAGLLAASVGWSHSVVLFVLGLTFCLQAGAGLLVLAGEDARVVPVNWISLTAVFLWLLVAPLPPGTYARLTLALQDWVTAGVLESLHLLGVPAQQRGNVIELARATVGVEEACSGIRSLLSCVYAGFFFAAWQVRRPAPRAVLILLAPLLAIGMNFVRSLALTLMANGGIDIAGFWHDATGFAILGFTTGILAALAWRLSPRDPPRAAPPDPGRPGRANAVVFWAGQAALALVLGFFLHQLRPAARPPTAAPDLAALLPARANGWDVVTRPDLYRFSGVLRTEQLFERTYLRKDGAGLVQVTVYVAWWPAGQASVSLVASHTPDACWPGAGWSPAPNPDREVVLAAEGRRLPRAEHRLFVNAAQYSQHVWFWHVYDGRVIDPRAPYSVPALVGNALEYGFRREGDQCFIRISSNRPWSEFAGDPLLSALAANLGQLGL